MSMTLYLNNNQHKQDLNLGIQYFNLKFLPLHHQYTIDGLILYLHYVHTFNESHTHVWELAALIKETAWK